MYLFILFFWFFFDSHSLYVSSFLSLFSLFFSQFCSVLCCSVLCLSKRFQRDSNLADANFKKKKKKKKGDRHTPPAKLATCFSREKLTKTFFFFHFLPSSGPSFSNTLSSRWLSSVTCSESVGECPLKSYLSANFSHRNIFINASLVFMQRLIQKDNAIKRYRFTEGAGVSFISIRFKDLKVWKDRVWKSTQNNC